MNQSSSRYSCPAVVLHWIVGLLILSLIGIGLYMGSLPRGLPAKSFYTNLHKSIGVVALVLIAVRIAWRAGHRPPALPAGLPSWQYAASKASHHLLYLCMAVMPLTGFLGSNFNTFGIKFFGLQIPPLFSPNKPLQHLLFEVHETVAWVLIVVVAIHILAALKHKLDKDGIFERMTACKKAD